MAHELHPSSFWAFSVNMNTEKGSWIINKDNKHMGLLQIGRMELAAAFATPIPCAPAQWMFGSHRLLFWLKCSWSAGKSTTPAILASMHLGCDGFGLFWRLRRRASVFWVLATWLHNIRGLTYCLRRWWRVAPKQGPCRQSLPRPISRSKEDHWAI